MTASLTALILHRLRFELMEMGGLPPGLVATGYRLGELTFLVSGEFWAGILVRVRGGNQKWRPQFSRWRPQLWLPLSLLLPAAIFLTATVGPSSAIVMIPQLNWWDMRNPFDGMTLTTWVNFKNTLEATGPSAITKAFLPNNCANELTQGCPMACLATIERWVGDHQNNNILPNFAIANDSEVERYLTSTGLDIYKENTEISEGTEERIGYTVSSTVHASTARDLGAFWEIVSANGWFMGSLIQDSSRPVTIPSSIVGIKKPLVQVQCSLYYNDTPTSTMEFPRDLIKTSPANRFFGGNGSIPPF